MEKTLSYLQKLISEEKNNPNKDYILKLIENNYSYAIDNNERTPICGSDNFKPFTTKEELIQELSSMKTDNGEFIFSNKAIELIVNNENDIGELSKILNEIAKNELKLSRSALFELLKKEGVTLELVKPNIDFYKETQTQEKYKDIQEICKKEDDKIFNLKKEEIEQVKKNTDIIKTIKKYCPNTYFDCFKGSYHNSDGNWLEKEKEYEGYKIPELMDLLIHSKLNSDNFEQILKLNVYPEELKIDDLKEILQDESLNKSNEANLKLLNDIKKDPRLQIFCLGFQNNCSGYNGKLHNRDITKILKQQLPEDFSIHNNPELINFVFELANDKNGSKIIDKNNTFSYIDILIKHQNDNIEDGKKLVQFLLDNIIVENNFKNFYSRKFSQDKPNYQYLTMHSFTDTLNTLSRFKDNSLNEYSEIPKYDMKTLNDYLDAIDTANEFSSFKDCDSRTWFMLYFISSLYKELNIEIDKNSIKSKLETIDKQAKQMSPKLWKEIQPVVFDNIILNDLNKKPFTLKKDNIEYLDNLINTPEYNEYFSLFSINKVNFLSKDLNIDKLKANKNDMFKFLYKCKSYDNLKVTNDSFIEFEGDYKKLNSLLAHIKCMYPNSKLQLYINEEGNTVFIVNNYKKFVYDKNGKLLSENIETSTSRENGNKIFSKVIQDKKCNQKHYKIEVEDPVHQLKKTEKLTTKYYDKNNNLLKTKSYKPSKVDGAYNIEEKDNRGNVKTISLANQDEKGIHIEKHLTSLNGTTSDIIYYTDISGNEKYSYIIKNKEGKELTNLTRTTEIIDKDTKKNTVNNIEYIVKYSSGKIEVLNNSNNTNTVIDLKTLNPNNEEILNNLLRSMSGDELLNINKHVSELKLTNRIDSAINPKTKQMFIGAHKFILEHELGHAKDYCLSSDSDTENKIASDKKLQEIFNREKENVKENLSDEILKEIMYFIDDTKHYNGKLGGLRETIAETNALQSTGKFHPLLQMRTQLLQEYFPETISYLINNNLLQNL